ncbi:Calcineurin-like phosphoesterase [Candidatus Methanoperedenaceae archaeon GB37]|nr:Calcineurin-like phosphoesterase [Candidatus Methanoperedenaceae archaeon GB37]
MLNMVVFGDVHNQIDYIDKIKELPSADWTIITGDLTNCGGKKEAEEIINYIRYYNTHILAQIGNMDFLEINDYFENLGINLHGHGYRLEEELAVFGVGGSTPTPFNTPTEYSEQEIAAFLYTAYEEVKNVSHKILVSHTPPFGTKVDIVRRGEHVGSRVIREFIEKEQPELCLTGHIHEARNIDKIGKTLILNPGTIAQGYILVEWDGIALNATLASYK